MVVISGLIPRADSSSTPHLLSGRHHCCTFTSIGVSAAPKCVIASSTTSTTVGDSGCLDPPVPGALLSSLRVFSVFIHQLSLLLSPPGLSFASAMMAATSFVDVTALMSVQEIAARVWAPRLPLPPRPRAASASSLVLWLGSEATGPSRSLALPLRATAHLFLGCEASVQAPSALLTA
jgi:hypothetical protein